MTDQQFFGKIYNDLSNQSVMRRKASVIALKEMLKNAKSNKEFDLLSKALLIAESFLNGDENVRLMLKAQFID